MKKLELEEKEVEFLISAVQEYSADCPISEFTEKLLDKLGEIK